jgi:hypothetical protein
MSDPTPTPHPDVDPRTEAISWLAGQFRWEALLADLHELAEREAAPVVALPPTSATRTSEDEDAA